MARLPRPKHWGVKRMHLCIGSGPFKTIKRLIGTQWGLVYRTKTQAIILMYGKTKEEIVQARRQLCVHTLPIYHQYLFLTKNEPLVKVNGHIIPTLDQADHLTPGSTKTHSRTRRNTGANNHLKWWHRTAGEAKDQSKVGQISSIFNTAQAHLDGLYSKFKYHRHGGICRPAVAHERSKSES